MDNGLSAADVMALTKCNSSDPAMVAALTNDRRDDMWDNPFVYLVWIDQPIVHVKVRELLENPNVKTRTISSQASF